MPSPAFPNWGTTIIYNDVVIANVSTESVEQEAFFDATDSDQVGVKVSITVTGILHKWPVAFDGAVSPINLGAYVGDASGSGGGINIERFRDKLELLNKPMRRFTYRINDTTVWDVAPIVSDDPTSIFGYIPITGKDWDSDIYRPALNNTPKVSASVLRVISDSACWVRFTIEFIYNPCDEFVELFPGMGEISPLSVVDDHILSLKWWCADNIDTKTWLTTRAWSGVLQLKSRAYSPHIFRYLTFPLLPARGWKRDGIRFSESEDNLTLRFEIVDQEVIANPPFPASDWRGTVSINAPFAGVGVKTVEVSMELQAPPNIRKDHLAFLMLRIMDAKIQWYNFAATGTMFVQGIRLGEVLEANVVTGELSVQMSIGATEGEKNETVAFPELITSIFGNDMSDPAKRLPGEKPEGLPGLAFMPNYHAKEPPYWIPNSSSLAYLVMPYIQTPCNPSKSIPRPDLQGPVRRVWFDQQGQQQNDNDAQYKAGTGESRTSAVGGVGADGVVAPPPLTTDTASGVNIAFRAPYMMYRIYSRYITNTGLSAFPYFDNVNSTVEVAMARWHRPITFREFKWEATRINQWPVTPTRTPWKDPRTQIIHACQSFDVTAHSAEASADGRKYRFSVSGTAVYALSRTPTPEEQLYVGAAPHIAGLEGVDCVYLSGPRKHAGNFTTSSDSPAVAPESGEPLPPLPPSPPVPPIA